MSFLNKLMALQLIDDQGLQQTAGLTFACPQTEVNDDSGSLGVTSGLRSSPPIRCWNSWSKLLVQFRTFSNLSLYQIGTDLKP